MKVLIESHIFVSFTLFCFQGSSTKGYFLQRTLQSLERYVYLLVFNAYLHDQVLLTKFDISYLKAVMSARICHNLNNLCIISCLFPSLQYPQAFAQSFSQWMCMNAWIYRLLASMDSSELSAPANLITNGIRVLVRAQPQTQ